MNNQRIGFKAEMQVASVLPGAVVLNENKEQRKPYDLLWNDIQIDVKGTENVIGINKKVCTFTANLSEAHTGVILVLIGMLEDRDYFWVKPYTNDVSLYCKLADSISGDELPRAILDVAGLPVEKILGSSVYSQLKLNEEYKERLAKLAAAHNRSMANMVEVLINEKLKEQQV